MMKKPRMSLLPWDCLRWSDDITPELLGKLARLWWARKTDALPPVLPRSYLAPVAQVFTFGAEKYAARGWENDTRFHSASQHIDSLFRHATAPSELDEESGLPNTWHMACRYIMLATLASRGLLVDDRPPVQPSVWDEADEIEIDVDVIEGAGLGGAVS